MRALNDELDHEADALFARQKGMYIREEPLVADEWSRFVAVEHDLHVRRRHPKNT